MQTTYGNRIDKLPDSNSTTSNINHKSGEFPNLGLKVYLVGNCFRAGAVSMFARAGCRPADTIEDAELICFLGGEDVDPALYGEKVLRGTYFNRARDDVEMEVFLRAQAAGIPCFGICRGMQFLHVMNGGKLYQHVMNHAGCDHEIVDVRTGETQMASSMHHQMLIADSGTVPLAIARGHSGFYATYGSELSSNAIRDLEACTWPGINAIGVQGHPEVGGNPEYTAYCLRLVEEFLAEDAAAEDVRYAINPDAVPPAIN